MRPDPFSEESESAMSTVELHADRAVEADELREELERLQAAIASLTDAVVEAQQGRAAAEGRAATVERKIADHRLLLDQAMALQVALRGRLHELEAELEATRAELGRERTLAAIRGKLLADIGGSTWLARRRAIERAVRVERLLG
jgi:chromosome segregation ATPase